MKSFPPILDTLPPRNDSAIRYSTSSKTKQTRAKDSNFMTNIGFLIPGTRSEPPLGSSSNDNVRPEPL